MVVERTEDGRYSILADWLEDPVIADTFEDAYELAIRARVKAKARP